MGGDESIVQAARVSYGRGTRKVQEDKALIRYLMRHRHTTPFEMCEIKLHVRVPMDTWRQWIRHRTANVNEYSTRYSIAIDSAQRTLPTAWRQQSTSKRQGSEGFLDKESGTELSESEAQLHEMARALYKERLDKGVAREQARKDLLLSTYTEAYWKIDLWNLLHFLGLRMDAHAQLEIRQYAETIGHQILSRWVPIAWAAFQDYQLDSVRLSSHDVQMLRHLIAGDQQGVLASAKNLGWLELDKKSGKLRRNRERDEFERKVLDHFGLNINWTK